MKKLMITAALMTAFAANAVEPGSPQWEAVYLAKARAYVTNHNESAMTAYFPLGTNVAFWAQMDEVLKAKPPFYAIAAYKAGYDTKLPKTVAAAKERYSAAYPMLARVADGISPGSLSNDDRIEYEVERLPFVCYKTSLDKYRKNMGVYLGRRIVKTLRRQGKAVTTGPDGISPVKAYADRISAALDAPRFEGLAEILEEMGVKAKLNLIRFGTAEEATALMNAIMDGDKDLTPQAEFIISTGLGIAAYNQFVERYNGGTR